MNHSLGAKKGPPSRAGLEGASQGLDAHQILGSRSRCEQELLFSLASLLQAAESVIRSTHSPSEDLHFYTTKTLAELLGISVRSLNRCIAAQALPEPDLWAGPFPRWSRKSIVRWLATRPRLPGRRKGGRA
jgi:hypothetical protein